MIRVVYTGTKAPPEVEGVQVLHAPVLKVEEVPFQIPPDAHTAVFFSQNAVEVVAGTAEFKARDWKAIWAVGEKTQEALESGGVEGVQAASGSFEAFLAEHDLPSGDGVVAFGLLESPRRLSENLLGSIDVPVYRTTASVEDFECLVDEFDPAWVVIGSPRAWEACHQFLPDGIKVAVLGESTASELPHVDYISSSPALEVLLQELAEEPILRG